jgi:hypothetical protein
MMADETEITRIDPPAVAPEKETLLAFLDYQRATLLQKLQGVSEADLQRPAVPPSNLTLLTLVKHLAYVERSWFQWRFKGIDFQFPWTKEDPDPDFRIEPDETAAGIIAFYQGEVTQSRRIVAEASLDDLTARPWPSGELISLRWVVVHMIEETARHNGHADLLREAIDGVTGE